MVSAAVPLTRPLVLAGDRPVRPTGPRPPIRLLLCDDHAVVRAGLRALLSSADGIEVVGEAGSGEEAARPGRPRCAPTSS